MAGDQVEIVQLCGVCGTEVGTFSVKKENMILSSKATVWCPKCQADTPEVRDMVGRLDSIRKEVESLPKAGVS